MENLYYVGLDVHKETVDMAIFLNNGNEPALEKRYGNDHGRIISELKKLQRNGQVSVCYEAGCMGFTLQRALHASGIECRILSPGNLPRKPGDRVKTDKKDARNLAKYLRTGESSGIHVPTVEDEATRDFIRARDDIKHELKRAKQQLMKFLLRLGHGYDASRYWTVKHMQWMKKIEFPQPIHQETFQAYLSRIQEMEERLVLMDVRIVEIAQGARHHEAVGVLRCFKGIDHLTALAFVSEIGDFRRFPNAKSFMAYLGLIPREHSSGEKRRQGGITKAGNGHLRRLLVEASWHYRYVASPSKKLTERRMGQRVEVIAHADKALRRLQRKFTKMLLKGKSKNATVIAVSRELAGFIWGVMNDKFAA